MWGFIWRNCKDLSASALRILYCSLVRSHLEYCSSVWCPIYNVDSLLLEKVQKKFLRTIEFKMGHRHVRGEYSWIMSCFNIQELGIRRSINDAHTLHNIINGRIDNSELLRRLTFLVPASGSCTTRSRNIFRIRLATSNLAKNHPLRRMMDAANRYTNDDKVEIFNSSVSKFRKQILKYFGF